MYDIAEMERELHELRRQVADLARTPGRWGHIDQEELRNGVRAVRAQMAELSEVNSQLELLRREVDKSGLYLADVGGEVRQLATRVAWLERHVRVAETMEAFDLQGVDRATARLADTAERGRQARAELLPDERRSELASRVEAFADLERRQEEHMQAALAASVALAETEFGTDEHMAAAEAFPAACQATREARDELRRLVESVDEAKEELAADDARWAERAAVIEAGDAAWSALCGRLRVRIAEALRRGELFPVWFTTALSVTPPPDNTSEWMDLATGLLAYRVTCKVDDPVLALGPRPSGDQAHRAGWYDQLDRQLRERDRY
jgi:hypothetical protein